MELIRQLRSRQEFFVAAFMAALVAIPGYGHDTVDREDLRQAAADSFTVLTDSLLERFVPDAGAKLRLATMAHDLAHRRAVQGIQVSTLVDAVRTDFTVLWEQLMGISRPDDAPVLVELAKPLWQVVDDYASAVYEAFLEVREAQARQEAATLQQYLTELFTHRPDAERLSRMSVALGLPVAGPLMLAGAPVDSRPDFLHDFVRDHGGPANACHEATVGELDVVLFPAGRTKAAKALCRLPCAVIGPVAGLAALSSEQHKLVTLCDLLRPTDRGALTMPEAWPRISAAANTGAGNDLAQLIDKRLSAARPTEASRVRETVQVFLRTGSAKRTAELTFCHRNTVLNHLNRFAELTGVDVTIPEQAAMVVVAWA